MTRRDLIRGIAGAVVAPALPAAPVQPFDFAAAFNREGAKVSAKFQRSNPFKDLVDARGVSNPLFAGGMVITWGKSNVL